MRYPTAKMSNLRKRLSSSVNGALKPVLSPFIHSSSVPFTLVPWRISYNAVYALLNAREHEREYLVNIWKESKLHELGVIVISVLCLLKYRLHLTDD
jgi:hypothetical protein